MSYIRKKERARLVNRKNKVTALITAVSMSLSLTGCFGEEEYHAHSAVKTISFSWWGKDQRNEYTLEAVKQFEDKTGYAVEVYFSEYEGFKNTMDMEFYSGTESDVMQLNYDWLYEYSPDGEGFYDLNELSEWVDLSVFPESDLSCGIINGKLNALPTSFNAITFYYNKGMYESYGLELPKTWEDIYHAAEVMSPDGIYPLALSSKSVWLSAAAWFEQSHARQLYRNSTELEMSQEDYKELLGFYVDLLEKGVTKHSDDFDRNDLEREKIAGQAVWISDAEYYCDPSLKLGLDIVIGDYPCIEGAEVFGWYKKPTSLYAIKKETKNPKEAGKLLDYLENSKEMNTLQKLGKGIPSSRAALEILESCDLLTGIQFDANEKMKSTGEIGIMSPYIEDTEAVALYSETVKRISSGELTLDEAAEETYDEMYELLKS